MSRLVLCHGCFDVLHVGHVWHLRAARAMGSKLVVSITGDAYITKPGRPVFSEQERIDHLRELRCVDDVYISQCLTGRDAILHFWPKLYVKGVDYAMRGVCELEALACKQVSADVVYTDTKKYGSGALLEFVR